MVNNYPLILYMWFNIDTRGHEEAPKSQNLAVVPEDPPGNYKTLGDKGLKISDSEFSCKLHKMYTVKLLQTKAAFPKSNFDGSN